MTTKIIQVIWTDLEVRGAGTANDPVRRIEQIYSMEGKLLMEQDPCQNL